MKQQILKSFLLVVLSLILILSVVSCTDNGGNENKPTDQKTETKAPIVNGGPQETEPKETEPKETEPLETYPEDGPDWSLDY